MGILCDNITSFISFACWSILFLCMCLLDKKRHYTWHFHTVVLIHAIVALMLSGYSAFIQGPWSFTNAGGDNTEFQQFVLVVSLGYFIFDTIYFLILTPDPTMLIHHGVSWFFAAWSYSTRRIGTGFMMMLFLAEITNPLLQLRWFLRETNKPSYIRSTNEVVFVAIFSISRVIVMPYFTYSYFQQDTDIMGRVGGMSVTGISFVLWFQVMKFFLNKYTSPKNINSPT